MSVVIITGSSGLVGSEAVKFFCDKKYDVVGIDNNMRKEFFGKDACTDWKKEQLKEQYKNYKHCSIDIRNNKKISSLFKSYQNNISLIIHAAAQPSHDLAAVCPHTDFMVNAAGTLFLLENYRQHCPDAVFIFTSTNKVYGDKPNELPLEEKDTRYELKESHKWFNGIDETMSIDQSKHSIFGASKLSADTLVQEYGRYFGLKTVSFRSGCITGPAHSGTKLHGFLSYLMKCCVTGKKYMIYGYKGKQVRDNIHSHDLVNVFYHFFKNPTTGGVYNIGGSRHSNISVLEAIDQCQKISGFKLNYELSNNNRNGDHKWWISSVSKFKKLYPEWDYEYDSDRILKEIYKAQRHNA